MFVMTNDGGLLDGSDILSAERVLNQRLFIFDLMAAGVAVTLLNGAEFQDSKVGSSGIWDYLTLTNMFDRYFRSSTNRGLMEKFRISFRQHLWGRSSWPASRWTKRK